MTKNRDHKQLVRERMDKTGESYATARRNLERTDDRIAPKGWTLRGATPQDYELYVEPVLGPDGRERPCACVRSKAGAAPEDTSAEQCFTPDDYRGSRVRLSCWLRAESLTGYASLWMSSHENTKMLIFFQGAGVRGDDGWARREVVLDIDEEATLIFIGVRVAGTGAAWMSDVSLERVGKDVPVSASREISSGPVNLDFTAR